MLTPEETKQRFKAIKLNNELTEKQEQNDRTSSKLTAGLIALTLIAAAASAKPKKKRWWNYL